MSAWNNWAPTARILKKFDYISKNLPIDFKFNSNLTRMTETLREDWHKILIITASILLRTKNVLDKNCRETRKTHFIFNNIFNRAVYEITWKKCGRGGQSTDDKMAHAHCMLDTSGYECTHTLCNSHCFSTATTVTRTRLNVTFIRTLPVSFNWKCVSPFASGKWLLASLCLSVCPHVSGQRPEV
jgi:hypothetical protein